MAMLRESWVRMIADIWGIRGDLNLCPETMLEIHGASFILTRHLFVPFLTKKDYYVACGTFSQLNRLGEKSTILNRLEVTYTSGTGCLGGAHVATTASRGACEVCVLRGPRMCVILSARSKARCTMKQYRSRHVLTQKSQT